MQIPPGAWLDEPDESRALLRRRLLRGEELVQELLAGDFVPADCREALETWLETGA